MSAWPPHSHDHHRHHHYPHEKNGMLPDGQAKYVPGLAVRNIAVAFILNAVFAVIELVGGWWTGSVAIQADAIHDFGDALALAAAMGLQLWSGASANGRFNFGYKRLSLLSALGTSFILFLGSLYILVKAVDRLLVPKTPELNGMFVLAVLGVLVNGYAAWKMSGGRTQNERALTWHLIEDLLGWIAVLIGSIVMRFTEAPWIDPAMSLVIAGVIILGSTRNIWASMQLFLQAAPGTDFMAMRRDIEALEGVRSIESLKSWSLDGYHHVASLHAAVSSELHVSTRQKLKQEIRVIVGKYGEFDLTIEWDES